jgi:drug/metabolite transporter (DMT)-like permease
MSSPATGSPRPSRTAVGWIEAGLFVLVIGLIGAVYTIANELGAHAVAFMLTSMLLSGSVLTILTGAGRNALRITLAPLTWVFGVSYFMVETLYFVIIQWVTAAEASLLVRLSIPISLAFGFVVAGRRPRPLAWLGALIVTGGVGTLVARLDLSRQWQGLAGAALIAVLFVACGFASELHPWNRAARGLMDRLRVTALVTLLTALAGWLLVAAGMLAVHRGWLAPLRLLPRPVDLVHPPTLWLALLVGGVMFTALNFLYLSSVVTIGAERFVAASAFMPPTTYLVLLAAAAMGLVAPVSLDWGLVPAMALAIAGILVVIAGSRPRPAR